MPAQLLALSEGPSISLDKPILLIGRDQECDIRFDSRKISRKHCCIAQVDDYLVVRDLGSTNGVRINGVRVVEGRLKAGDELTIGSHRYQVRWDELAMAPPRQLTPRAVQKQEPPAKDGTAQPSADELLEECDEPVPLSEHGLPRVPVPKPKSSAPPGPAEQPKEAAQGSAILPEHLSLAPASEVAPPKPGKDSPA